MNAAFGEPSLADLTLLVLCAGSGERWNNHLGIPKQLAVVGAETLLHRSERMVRAWTRQELICVTGDERLSQRARVLRPAASRFTVETLLSTASTWGTRTVVLLGDVYYTSAAVRTILSDVQSCTVFGRPGRSAFTRSDHGEIFGMQFGRAEWPRLQTALRACVARAERGERGNLWDLYYELVGPPLGTVDRRVFVEVNDLTDDCDSPADYQRLCSRVGLIKGSPLRALLAVLERRCARLLARRVKGHRSRRHRSGRIPHRAAS